MRSFETINIFFKRAESARTLLLTVVALAACFSAPGAARASGTPAGTAVKNDVSVAYVQDGAAQAASASSTFVVDRVVNVTVTNNSNPSAAPAQLNVPISFRVTNTGNSAQRYALQAVSRATNTWTMDNVRIYLDNNNSGSWDAADTLYADAGTFGDLASDASFTVLIAADTPGTAVDGQSVVYELVAASVDAGTLTSSVQTDGPNTSGVDSVLIDSVGSAAGDAARDGKHSAAGTITVTSLAVSINKTVSIKDQWEGSLPMPGATLTYTLTVSMAGSGTAVNFTVSDPIPGNTSYRTGTLRLNDAALTDAADTDMGDVGGTLANTVTVKLGSLTSATPTQTISFEVKIQ